MKRFFLILTIIGLSSFVSLAQGLDDALRYSKNDLSGTARYVSMGGAFGALGGDISSISDNPASTGVFMYSEMNISPTVFNSYSSTDYLGTNMNDNKLNFNFNNLGFVGSVKSKNSNWKVFNYAFSYKRLNNYHQSISAEGINGRNSITDFFANQANGTTLDVLDNEPDYNYIGDNAFYTKLIEPFNSYDGLNDQYNSVFNQYGQTQMHSIQSTGRRTDFSFSIGGNYKNKLYLGASLDYSSIIYSYSSQFIERDFNKNIDNFLAMEYNNEYTTKGEGYTLKLGVIYKPKKWLRMAYAIHAPLVYNLTDEYSHSIESMGIDVDGLNGDRLSESPLGIYEYNITTPMKMMGALGFVIGKHAVIGLEYEFVDYTMMQIQAVDNKSDFIDENKMIDQIFKPAHNAKAGVEYRLGQISFRAGFTYIDSPYKSTEINKDAFTLIYSGGLGFNFDFFYMDFAYSLGQNKSFYFPYQLDESYVEPYEITQYASKFITTMGLRF